MGCFHPQDTYSLLQKNKSDNKPVSEVFTNDTNILRQNTEILAYNREMIVKGMTMNDDQNSLIKEVETMMSKPMKEYVYTSQKFIHISSVIAPIEQAGFENKQIKIVSEGFQNIENNIVNSKIAYSCKKGIKPSPNQDDFFILIDDRIQIFGVMDGHGIFGHFCSDFVKQMLPRLILSNPNLKLHPELALTQSFIKVNDALLAISTKTGKFSSNLSGTTATILMILSETLYVAHVGDSRSIMGVSDENLGYKGVDLTRDHCPNLADEKARILENGGDVRKTSDKCPYRVYAKGGNYPGLAMSRAIGDTASREFGIISDPEIKVIKLDNSEEFILLCSDGVWEFLSTKQVIDFVYQKYNENNQLSHITEYIAKKAFDLWLEKEINTSDDITCLLISLKK